MMNDVQRSWLTHNRTEIVVVALTLLAAFLRFFLIGAKTVWLDEAFSIWLARHPLWEMWGWLVRIDQHPPLYYTLLHGWIGLFGDLQGPVRGLSALCSTLAVPVYYAAIRRLLDRPTALIAAFILAVSPFQVRFAQETRMYGLLTLAVAMALYCAVVVLRQKDAPRWVWWGLAVSQAAVMLTHNTAAVYFPAALNLAVGLIVFNAKRRRGRDAEDGCVANTPDRRADLGHGSHEPSVPAHLSGVGLDKASAVVVPATFLHRWLVYQGVALLLWLPWAWPFVVQCLGVDRQFWIWPPTVGMVAGMFYNFNFAFLPGGLAFQAVGMALYAALFLLGIWHLRRTSAVVLLLSLLFAPVAIALLVSLRRPIFYDRTLIWLTLPYYALMAVGIRAFRQVPHALRAPRRMKNAHVVHDNGRRTTDRRTRIDERLRGGGLFFRQEDTPISHGEPVTQRGGLL